MNHDNQAAFRSADSTVREYVASIAWDVEGPSPRTAGEQMWENVLTSDGPIVELRDKETGAVVRVDLAREAGEGDIEDIQPARTSAERPGHQGADGPADTPALARIDGDTLVCPYCQTRGSIVEVDVAYRANELTVEDGHIGAGLGDTNFEHFCFECTECYRQVRLPGEVESHC